MVEKLNDYKAIEIRCDTANDWIPPVRVNTGDLNGRTLRAVLTDAGKNITSEDITARLLFNSKPDDPNSFGDFVTMTPIPDTQTATFEAPVPTGALANTGDTRMGFSFAQGSGDSRSIVCTRPFEVTVEGGVLNFTSGGAVGEFEAMVDRAETAADNADKSAQAADASEKLAAQHLVDIGTSKEDAAASATAADKSAQAAAGSAAAAKTSQDAAKASETAAKTSQDAAKESETAAKASQDAAADSATAAAGSAKNAQDAVDNFGIDITSTTTEEPGTQATVTSTKTGTRYGLAFAIPRGDNGWSMRAYNGVIDGGEADRAKITPDTDLSVGDGLICQTPTDTGDLTITIYTITALADAAATVRQLSAYTLKKGVKGDTGTIENLTIDPPLTGNGTTTPIGLDVAALRGDGIGGTEGRLAVKPKAAGGIEVTTDGVAAAVDGTTVTLQDGKLHAPGGAKILHATFAPTDFNADLVAVKAIEGLGDVNFVAPDTSSIDNVDAYSSAAPVIQDHADDETIPAGSIRMTCVNEPTTDITLSIATFKEQQQ